METIKINNEIKDLIKLNAGANYLNIPAEYEKVNGKYTLIPDLDNIRENDLRIINKNIQIINERKEARNNRRYEILTGDYLRMPDGSCSRITYNWGHAVQDGGGAGSFHLSTSGNASYSGGLDGAKDIKLIKPTVQYKKALFWIFSEGRTGAHRSFNFYIDVRVWKIDSMMKTAYLQFADRSKNYHTSVNGKLSNDEIKNGFIGKQLNLGNGENDDVHICTDCAVYY